MRKMLVSLFLFLSLCVTSAYANDAQEKIYLTQILNELDAIQPLILAAQAQQSKNTRTQFHYIHYRDGQGQLHNGLLEDVQAIKSGITQALNQLPMEPRVVAPIQGDYTKG